MVSTLGERVRFYRNLLGLSQHGLADRVGITQARVSQIEAGHVRRKLPRRTLTDLADGLGVGLGDLIGSDPAYIELLLESSAMTTGASTGLPPLTSSLIGRETELAALTDLLSTGTRLLSLVGPGGVGKTHLALHAARQSSSDFARVTVVSLVACTDAAQVVSTVAHAIGVREHDSRPLRERFLAELGAVRRLVLLDNIEQALPTVGPLITELLATCPQVTLLVTSRTPLWIRGEYIFPIAPLELPASEATTATVAASPAAQLFLQRAAAASTYLTLNSENAATVAEIVRRLDGLPLAIELAAARARAFSLPAMLGRLDSRLAFLTGGPRDLPARQQTLRTAIAWSYNLLPADERKLFRQLAVFAEGFTVEAATWVSDVEAEGGRRETAERRQDGKSASRPETLITPTPHDPITRHLDTPTPSSVTLDRLATLLDWSLITGTAQADGTVRFGMLETIHEFARERLEAAGEMTALRQRHLQWSLAFAELAVSKLNTAEEVAWLPRLRQEDANLQAALTWAFASGHDADLELGFHLAGVLATYWLRCGRLSEARAWLTRAIDSGANRAPSAGQARVQAGVFLMEQAQEAVERTPDDEST